MKPVLTKSVSGDQLMQRFPLWENGGRAHGVHVVGVRFNVTHGRVCKVTETHGERSSTVGPNSQAALKLRAGPGTFHVELVPSRKPIAGTPLVPVNSPRVWVHALLLSCKINVNLNED